MKLGSAADFLLDISETDLSTLTANIKAPSGRDEPCLLKRLPNNHIGELWIACMMGWGQGLLTPPLGSEWCIAVCYVKPVLRMYASAFVLVSLDTGLLQRKGVLFIILRVNILLASFLSAVAKYPTKAA